MPGFGTGTWAAFQTIAKAQFGLDATKDFQVVEGNPGDLEGLLQTKSIDAFITFSAPTAHAISNTAYTMLYNITDEWKKANGAYLTINGWIAEAKWLDDHLEIIKNFIAGAQKGLEDVRRIPRVVAQGRTKYEQWRPERGPARQPPRRST